jgi:MYXO-CTERM domain-containing protein
LNYPSGGWLHPHSALALRQDPADSNRYELYFQLGSDTNFADTTRTVALGGSLGITGNLAGDAVHRIELLDGPAGLSATGRTQIATGLRNPTGMAFHPATGDFYLGDNGIDGLVNVNEPHSADEIHVIPAADLGNTILDFGFPSTYEEYRTGVTIGTTGELPLATFQPIPPPNGAEAEGVNEIAFAPPLFPEPLVNGLFAGFHGRFGLAGAANEENPVAFVDLDDLSQFHFVPNSDPSVGHLDGLLATTDTLYLADISSQGGFSGSAQNSGKIYAIKSLIPSGDYDRDGDVDGHDFLQWQRQLGSSTPAFVGADGDGNRLINGADLAVWRGEFGSGGAAASQDNVPEPNAVALAGLGALLAISRRRSASAG